MAQHFLKSAACRDLPLATVLRMAEDEAYEIFCKTRWPDGPRCPRCGRDGPYAIRRQRFRCCHKGCRCEFGVTSGTIFASHKLSFRSILAVISMSANAPNGKSALQVSRELGVQYKTAWSTLMKLRQAVAAERQSLLQDEPVEVDGLYIGGNGGMKSSREEHGVRRRRQDPRRRCVIGIRQTSGRMVTVVSPAVDAELVMPRIRALAAGASVRNRLLVGHPPNAHSEVLRPQAIAPLLADVGAPTASIGSYFKRLRRAVVGVHHRIASQYLDWYAADLAWKEDMRRRSNGDLTVAILKKALGHPATEWLRGNRQGNRRSTNAFMVRS